jgi:drug/metabolite transporter (DMT)-like permease
MWTLFTTALAKGNSTTQVSIMNTSSNFVITAILGLAIFSEALPPLWWLGAAMLVAGNVIIGSKDEGKSEAANGEDEAGVPTSGGEGAVPAGRGSRGRVDGADEEDAKIGDVSDGTGAGRERE